MHNVNAIMQCESTRVGESSQPSQLSFVKLIGLRIACVRKVDQYIDMVFARYIKQPAMAAECLIAGLADKCQVYRSGAKY
jgi:hypothetical protein